MSINWGGLGLVFVVALVAVVAVAALFSGGVLGLSRRADAQQRGGSGTVDLAGSVVCFALCTALVGYGIYLIVA